MPITRDARRCAIQAMYQFDLGHDDAPVQVRESLCDSPGSEASHAVGFELAQLAWQNRQQADSLIAELTPDWPVYRQPVIDRNILRLACYEMHHSETPPKVAINDAIELAREFSTEKSPSFINGVLDRIYRRLRDDAVCETPEEAEGGDGMRQ